MSISAIPSTMPVFPQQQAAHAGNAARHHGGKGGPDLASLLTPSQSSTTSASTLSNLLNSIPGLSDETENTGTDILA